MEVCVHMAAQLKGDDHHECTTINQHACVVITLPKVPSKDYF